MIQELIWNEVQLNQIADEKTDSHFECISQEKRLYLGSTNIGKEA